MYLLISPNEEMIIPFHSRNQVHGLSKYKSLSKAGLKVTHTEKA